MRLLHRAAGAVRRVCGQGLNHAERLEGQSMEGASRRRAAPGSQFVESFGIEALCPMGGLAGIQNSASLLPLTGKVFYAWARKYTLASKQLCNPWCALTPHSSRPPTAWRATSPGRASPILPWPSGAPSRRGRLNSNVRRLSEPRSALKWRNQHGKCRHQS